MGIIYACDECGSTDGIIAISLATGRVQIDGEDKGQDCFLCATHKPAEGNWRQPTDCSHIQFYWPGQGAM